MTRSAIESRIEPIGVYPTPVERLTALGTSSTTLWVKRDDLTNPVYGGNKVRKLERLLFEACRRGKRRIVTVGAAGSHHVLATTLFGGRAGFEVDAILTPQRATPHVAENLRADLGLGAHLHTARTYPGAALGMLLRAGRDAYLVPVGGSNLVGSLGYVDAAFELANQVKSGALPEPDAVVVTVGSGGTAAGITAGLALAGLRSVVIGVLVSSPAFFVGLWTRRLARQAFWHRARETGTMVRTDPGRRLELTARWLGAGYGEPTDEGRKAMAVAADQGLSLDLTYTAKCFAAALDCVQSARFKNVLYWHTLSSAPLAPLLEEAPDAVPPELARLLRQ